MASEQRHFFQRCTRKENDTFLGLFDKFLPECGLQGYNKLLAVFAFFFS